MRTRRHLLRFGVVGLLTNGLLYLGYVALTALGIGHKVAMTALYCVGTVQGFLLNRRWTFEHAGPVHAALGRYWALYAGGYLLNLALLYALVDVAGLAHQPVQAALIALVAGFTFVLQKHWVFRG